MTRKERMKIALGQLALNFPNHSGIDYAISLKRDRHLKFKVRVKGVSGFSPIKIKVNYFILENGNPYAPSRAWIHRNGGSEQHTYNESEVIFNVRPGIINRPQIRAWGSRDYDLVCFHSIIEL